MTNYCKREAKEIIDSYGGSTALAKKLNYNVQRVQNWKTRGIPPLEKLKFPDLFLKPKQESLTATT